MSFLGFKKYPAPVLKPMLPFIVGGLVTFYAVNYGQKAMLTGKSDSFLLGSKGLTWVVAIQYQSTETTSGTLMVR